MCCQRPSLCIRQQDHSHGRAESKKVLRLPGGPQIIDAGTLFDESSAQSISRNFITYPLHEKNTEKAIDSCQFTKIQPEIKPGRLDIQVQWYQFVINNR